MKIKEIIKETHEDTIENLRNECSQTIDLMKKSNEVIYHGSNFEYLDVEKITPKSGRTPKDIPQALHYLINEYLYEKGIKTTRSNSIFGLKNYEYGFGYGNHNFVLFPVNNANVLWFEGSDDLYISFYNYFKYHVKGVDLENVTQEYINENKTKFKEMLDTLKPNTSLKQYFYNNDPDVEILISSPLYVVINEVFETDDFKYKIGLE